MLKTYLGAFAGGGEEEKGRPRRGSGSEQGRHQQKVVIIPLFILSFSQDSNVSDFAGSIPKHVL